jgi:hypothetical protein
MDKRIQKKCERKTMIPFAALLSIGEKVLDKVIPDPEAKAKAQATLMEMAQRGELAQLEAQVKEMQSAPRPRGSNCHQRVCADVEQDCDSTPGPGDGGFNLCSYLG